MPIVDLTEKSEFRKALYQCCSVNIQEYSDPRMDWAVMLSVEQHHSRMTLFISPDDAREIAAKLNDFATFAEQRWNPANEALVAQTHADIMDDPAGE